MFEKVGKTVGCYNLNTLNGGSVGLGQGAECDFININLGKEICRRGRSEHYAPAEDLTLILQTHAGILPFLPPSIHSLFLSSQLVLSSSGHVCQLSLKG